ncbi:NrfD/PsrC family molybdoenzyme membrane anchor subunit [Sulfurospirillum arcachonense]|uniref:NrfD/PsrC family molybdoenzyme membrane anchor subunit n=1 Tax=Sulfurospirillum arcachonense TaxID=57666 RepID=UPI00046A82BF|nr:NrfD/PsrC family molybdoenzyme membrane anchor subunit [Sulfurospirillum arcachonense]
MNESINFTVGFTEGIGWHWPIAVYLLLAGISGGALILALAIRFYKKQTENTAVYKSSALISCSTIMLGMVFLVADLEKPFVFWKILINYNFSSVMSIGVAAISVYIPLTCVIVIYAFEKEIKSLFGFLSPIIDLLKIVRSPLEGVTVFFAVIICAYTGFLISILVRFPMLNTAILPALFVVSGLSVGVASLSLVSHKLFKEDMHSGDMKILHKVEWPIMFVEVMFLSMLYVGLLVGGASGHVAIEGFHSGVWANVFWFGVVGIGFILPLVLNFALGKKMSNSLAVFYTSGLSSLVGVFCLRLFIVYAGQIFSV